MIVAQLKESLREEWPRDSTPALVAFYGNPIGFDGNASPVWERANIRQLVSPYPLHRRGTITTIAIHRKCYESLVRVLSGIKKRFTPLEIRSCGLDHCGDVYSFGRVKGSTRLSTHAYGCAIDIAPHSTGLPPGVILEFEDEGWTWGGSTNPMHFQATVE